MNNDDEKNIPSPYVDTLHQPSLEDEAFIKAITEVCRNHGYNHFFISFAHNINDRGWKGFSGGLSEGLVAYLEIMSRAMRETWDNLKRGGIK